MSVQQLNAALVFPQGVNAVAHQMSDELSQKEETYFVLDDENFFAHVTLYAPHYPMKNLDNIIQELKKISEETPSFSLSFTHMRPGEKWLGVALGRTSEIMRLHEQVVLRLSPFREKAVGETDLHGKSPKQQEQILQYGRTYILDLYEPHLTLTRFVQAGKDEEYAASLSWPFKESQPFSLCLFLSGDHGVCTEKLAEFPFL